MDKVLVLGHTGKLGQALARAFGESFEVHGRSRSDGLDAGDPDQVLALLRELEPAIVLNAVALGGLEACEKDPAAALRLNALLPRFLAQRSAEQGFLLVHFSTDAVFDGLRRSGFYLESDRPSPTNLYGLSKLGGEAFIAAEADRYYVFRLSVLAGPPGANPQFLERVIARARKGESLRVANDVICSPSYVQDIAAAVLGAVHLNRPHGLYHLANSGSASLYELVRTLLDELHLEVPLEPVSQRCFQTPARRPLCTPMGSEKLEPLRHWREAMRDCCAARPEEQTQRKNFGPPESTGERLT